MRTGHMVVTLTLEMKSPFFYNPDQVMQTMLSRVFRMDAFEGLNNGDVLDGTVPASVLESYKEAIVDIPVAMKMEWRKHR